MPGTCHTFVAYTPFRRPHPPTHLTQDTWNDVVYLGSHIQFQPNGPWVTNGPPVISRPFALVGSCIAINAAGGACYVDANGLVPTILTLSGNIRVELERLRFTGVTGGSEGAVLVEQVRHEGSGAGPRHGIGRQGRKERLCAQLSSELYQSPSYPALTPHPGPGSVALPPALQGANAQFQYCEFTANTATVGAAAVVQDAATVATFTTCNFWQVGGGSVGGCCAVAARPCQRLAA